MSRRRLSPSTKEVTHGSHSSCLSAVLTTMRMCLFIINDWQVAFTNLNCFLVGSSSISRNNATTRQFPFACSRAIFDASCQLVMEGLNDDAICDFVKLTRNNPINVRFIAFIHFMWKCLECKETCALRTYHV
ncbi:hypothetical protein HID58_017877 [Brassica napus]|uniref:Uncharacterized protein n=1 Tax=Brassica napus TaxID=3708 RepID=A0ABQ8D8C8_BRANA|nr:hypothetical protein HID58_017877 [Brassica napus]